MWDKIKENSTAGCTLFCFRYSILNQLTTTYFHIFGYYNSLYKEKLDFVIKKYGKGYRTDC